MTRPTSKKCCIGSALVTSSMKPDGALFTVGSSVGAATTPVAIEISAMLLYWSCIVASCHSQIYKLSLASMLYPARNSLRGSTAMGSSVGGGTGVNVFVDVGIGVLLGGTVGVKVLVGGGVQAPVGVFVGVFVFTGVKV